MNRTAMFSLVSPISVIYREPLYRGLHIHWGFSVVTYMRPLLPLDYSQNTFILPINHYRTSISNSLRHCQGPARRGDHLTATSERPVFRGPQRPSETP